MEYWKINKEKLDEKLFKIKRNTAWAGGLLNLDDFPDISCQNCGAGFEEEKDEAK